MKSEKHGFFQITQKLFVRKDNLLLVLKDRMSQHGDLPGGRLNEDEFYGDWIDSIKRELNEELGKNWNISILSEPILIAKHKIINGNHPCLIIGYEGKWNDGTITLSDEHDFLDWVDIYTYNPDSLFNGYMLDAVRMYLKKCCF